MGKINLSRLLLGGIVAGLIIDILDYAVDGMWLAPRWSDALLQLGVRSEFSIRQITYFELIGIATGIATIWIYAAIRPRFGAGAKTAVYAALVSWFLGVLLPNVVFMHVMIYMSRKLTLFTTLGGLVEIVAGTVVGAALYKEAGSARPVAAEARKEAMRA